MKQNDFFNAHLDGGRRKFAKGLGALDRGAGGGGKGAGGGLFLRRGGARGDGVRVHSATGGVGGVLKKYANIRAFPL